MTDLLGGLCHVPASTAIMVSLIGGTFVIMLWSLVGGVIYLCYRPSEHAHLAEMSQDVTQLEHQIAQTEESEEVKVKL